MKVFLILIGIVAIITIVYLLAADIKVRKQNTFSGMARRYVKLLYMAQKASKRNKPVAEFYMKEAAMLERMYEARLEMFGIDGLVNNATTSELMKAEAKLSYRSQTKAIRSTFRDGFIRK